MLGVGGVGKVNGWSGLGCGRLLTDRGFLRARKPGFFPGVEENSLNSMYHRAMSGVAPDVSAFILAGGKSTRMGADKAFVALDGRTLLARALELARSMTDDVRIVGDADKFGAFAPVVEDVFPG